MDRNKNPLLNQTPGQLPVGSNDGLVHLSPAAHQQMLAAAVAASAGAPPPADSNKLPKFWKEKPEAWFSVFRGQFSGRTVPVSELAMFNHMLSLLPTVAVLLCRPLVRNSRQTSSLRQRLLLSHYQLSPLERGRLLYNCTSHGDRTPTAMLQAMSKVNTVWRPPCSSGSRGPSSSSNTSSGRRRGGTVLCKTYSRYDYRCDRPESCQMRDIIKTPGNAPAGRD